MFDVTHLKNLESGEQNTVVPCVLCLQAITNFENKSII